jgi:8-oxo-dGTP pyrophosphatase MutT (NUDIX family)
MEDLKPKLLAVMQHMVIINRKEVLLLRYSGYRGIGVEGLWGLPGGHYASGDPTADLQREVVEETGLHLGGSPRLLKNYVVPFPDGVERYGGRGGKTWIFPLSARTTGWSWKKCWKK